MGRAFDVVIGNLQTREYVIAQYTPQRVSEDVAANFEHLKLLGLSHEHLQYSGTSNHKVSFTLDFNGDPQQGQTAAQQRRFLLANCYAARATRRVKTAGPSGIVFEWPNLFSLTCAQMGVKIEHELFAKDGSPRKFSAQVTFEELRDRIIYAEDVSRLGTMRR